MQAQHYLATTDQKSQANFQGIFLKEKRYAGEEASTVKPYRAVKPVAVILLWVRFRLHSCDKRAKCPRAASVMPTLCARDREVREGMREMTAAPTSVTRPPHTSKDSSFCRFLHQTHTHTHSSRAGYGGGVGLRIGGKECCRDVSISRLPNSASTDSKVFKVSAPERQMHMPQVQHEGKVKVSMATVGFFFCLTQPAMFSVFELCTSCSYATQAKRARCSTSLHPSLQDKVCGNCKLHVQTVNTPGQGPHRRWEVLLRGGGGGGMW